MLILRRLTQVTDPTGTYQFTFDNMGRLTQATVSYTFLTSRSFTTSYSYDAASNRTGMTDPENGSTAYVYDTLNRLQTLTPPSAFTTGNFGFGYDALSRRTSLTRPNSITTNYSYDNLSRLLSVLHQSGSTTLDGASYTVDNAGNRTAKTDQRLAVTSNYTYDPIYELTQVTQGANTTESYTFDPVGNRLTSLSGSYSNNSSNEMTASPSATYTYDNNGNTLTKVVGSNSTTYAWDFENRLASVTLPGSGGTVTFKYDPFGRRIYKSSSSATSIFAFDGDNLVEETNSSGTAVARYADGLNIDEPLAMLRSSATSFYHADGLGSVTSLSSAAGSIANTYTYDSFGRLTASTGSLVNPFQYTARENDTETGLYYYRARYYDPAAGRFLSEDRVGFEAGTNFYPYVRNSSPNLWDPRGTQPCCGSFAVKYAGYGAAGGAGLVAVGSLGVDAVTGGVNIIATPAEIGLGAAAGGLLGYGVGTLADILTGNYCSSNPFRGKPGDVSTTRRPDGTPKQVRRYGPDGYPDTDVDYDHADHHPDVGSPHGHDWGRPADGSPPTHGDRGPGRPIVPTDPRPN